MPKKEGPTESPSHSVVLKSKLILGPLNAGNPFGGITTSLVRIKRKKKKTLKELRRQNKEAYGEFEAGWGENRTRKY